MALIALAGAVALYSLSDLCTAACERGTQQMAANNTAATAQLGRVEAKVSQLLDLRANSESGQNQNYPPLSVLQLKMRDLPSSGFNPIVVVKYKCDLKVSNSTRCCNGYRPLRAMRV